MSMSIPVTDFHQLSEDYLRIEQAIQYLEKNASSQPELGEIASAVGLSEYHFQRIFSRWAGISPKRFLQFLTKEGAKELLAQSENLLDTTYEVGLSSLGRLHDLFVTTEAVTPGEYKSGGAGLTIRYGLHDTPFRQSLDRHDGARHLPPRLRGRQRRPGHRRLCRGLATGQAG
jgi:AraC family transcriptional regulator, regulatory protein of adaptative response / methylated-DNA-[protein]-cysteine methyltransferase